MKLFNRKREPKPEKPARRWLARKARRPEAEAPEEFPLSVFAVVFTPQRKSIFELTEEGARECQALPESGATVFVFDGNSESKDRRIVLPKTMGDRAAKEHVYETIDDRARIIRVPSNPNVVYARDLLSLETFEGHKVIPGPLLIDHILGTTLEQATVFPIIFRDSNQKVIALIQYAVRPDSEKGTTAIGSIQSTSKPDGEIVDLIEIFATKNKIAIADQDITGPTENVMYQLARTLPSYPTENDLFGLPLSQVYKGMAVGAGCVAALGLLCNVYLGIEAGYLSVSASRAEKERDELAQEVTKMLTRDIRAFARSVSIDDKRVVQSAQDVWHPNATTKITCTLTKCTIDLVGSIERLDGQNLTQGGSQLVSNVVDEELVRNVLLQKAPSGFRKQNIAISGDANVITVTFEQQKANLPIFDLLPH